MLTGLQQTWDGSGLAVVNGLMKRRGSEKEIQPLQATG